MTIEIPNWVIYAEAILVLTIITSGLLVVVLKLIRSAVNKRSLWWCFAFLLTKKKTGVMEWTHTQFWSLAKELREENEEMFQLARKEFNAWDPPESK